MDDIVKELEKIEEMALSGGFGYGEDEGDLVLGYSKAEEVANPAGLTYGFRIICSAEVGTIDVDLFGYKGLKYSDPYITIEAQAGYGSYEQFCYHTWINPAQITAIRITSTQTQIDQMALNWRKEDVFGQSDSKVISVASYRTEQDYQTGIITIPLSIVLSFDTYIKTSILAQTTVDVLIFFGVRRDIAKPVYQAQKTSLPILPTKTGTKPVIGSRGNM